MSHKPLNKKQTELVRLVCEGHSIREASERVEIPYGTAMKLMQRDDVRRRQMAFAEAVLYNVAGKAAMVISEQLDNQNPWIQQQAARTILDYINTLKKGAQTAVVVNFGMPQPGMPVKEPLDAEGDVQ